MRRLFSHPFRFQNTKQRICFFKISGFTTLLFLCKNTADFIDKTAKFSYFIASTFHLTPYKAYRLITSHGVFMLTNILHTFQEKFYSNILWGMVNALFFTWVAKNLPGAGPIVLLEFFLVMSFIFIGLNISQDLLKISLGARFEFLAHLVFSAWLTYISGNVLWLSMGLVLNALPFLVGPSEETARKLFPLIGRARLFLLESILRQMELLSKVQLMITLFLQKHLNPFVGFLTVFPSAVIFAYIRMLIFISKILIGKEK